MFNSSSTFDVLIFLTVAGFIKLFTTLNGIIGSDFCSFPHISALVGNFCLNPGIFDIICNFVWSTDFFNKPVLVDVVLLS